MTAEQPHPQRCETCMNTDCEMHPNYRDSDGFMVLVPSPTFQAKQEIIREKGCASHSDNAAVAAKERERVLKEVSDYWEVGDCVYPTDHPHHQNSVLCHMQGHCIICFMKNRIESLRSSKQEQPAAMPQAGGEP